MRQVNIASQEHVGLEDAASMCSRPSSLLGFCVVTGAVHPSTVKRAHVQRCACWLSADFAVDQFALSQTDAFTQFNGRRVSIPTPPTLASTSSSMSRVSANAATIQCTDQGEVKCTDFGSAYEITHLVYLGVPYAANIAVVAV
ncbi:hypothetical protein A8144_13655 [Mycobacterium leprae 3125609]|nr:hypothetical protein A8144_13655 [Mycobacterium leprae 3125609]OAX70158.1 hypothetical protein A3216_13615 [Mycobacterium leprae 7935681]